MGLSPILDLFALEKGFVRKPRVPFDHANVTMVSFKLIVI
eukprot:gene1849-12866_t